MSADQLALFEAAAPSASPIALRHYQQDAIERLELTFRQGFRAPLLVLPTAAGKTVVAAEFIRTRAAGKRVLFLAPRRELVYQASAKLTTAGVRHGVILAGADHLRRDFDSVQVASIDTLRSRLRRRRLDPGEFHFVFMDEAHLAVTQTRKNLLARWPEARLIGLTATPTRKDGRALGVLFDVLVEPASAREC